MRPNRLFLGNVPLTVVIVVGTALSVLAYFASQRHFRDQANAEFSIDATQQANLIIDGFAQAIFAIESVGAFYSASKSVTPEQFESFTEPLLRRFPTITALGWVPRIAEANRIEFERGAHATYPGFRIKEAGPERDMVSAGVRPVYFPVRLIRPLIGNEAAVGFDIYSNPIRRTAINTAIKSGRTTSTARIRLVQEIGQQFSVLIISPVFGQQDLETGEREVRGVASAVYRIGDGVERALARAKPVRTNLWLYDRSDDVAIQFLYFRGAHQQASGQARDVPEPPIAGARYVHDFRLAGRNFRLLMTPAEDHFGMRGSYVAWTALGVGLLITGLLAAYIALTLRRSHELLVGQEALENEASKRERVELELREANQELQTLSREDALMGIFNRRYFDEYFSQEWKRALRHKTPLSLLLGDVDHFKKYNDTYGHVEGDKCLRRIAQVLRGALERPGDLVARYGGEEIALVLPSTPEAGARNLAERLRILVSSPSPGDVNAPSVTMSIGYGTIEPQPDSAMEDFLQAVDAALYRAKQQGRNCIVSVGSIG